jgi:hypothetical protein
VKSRLAIGLLLILALTACGRRHRTRYPYGYPNGYPNDPNAGVMMTQPSATASVATPPGPTEPTDADRAAARDLYGAGVTLQQQGKFGDALDKFQRSIAVMRVPTTQLHIAQCKVGLTHLVAGAEDYRAIMNTTLPPNSPPAFVDAQKLAGQELASLEPRIPHAKIVVAPNPPGLQVVVDGQSLNSALLGVPRPIDPGTHKVSLTAPGYMPTEQTFDIKEKESKDVPLTLKR